MQIDLAKLVNGSLNVDQELTFDSSYYENSDIKGLKDLKVNGKIYYGYEDEIILDLNFKGIIVLEDSYSLKLVDYNFEKKIEEEFTLEDIKNTKKDQNILDITEFLWQNIVLEVPISYTVEEEILTSRGEGWELKDKETSKIDPRLSKLAELLEKGKE